jgi:hypothetical protein
MSVAKLERYNLGVAIDNDPDGLWCHHSGHLASVSHLERRVRELEAALKAYGQHWESCRAQFPPKCTCGLLIVLDGCYPIGTAPKTKGGE